MNSAYQLLGFGGTALGTLVGGVVAARAGLAAPFWCAGAAMVVVTVVAWGPLRSTG